MSASRWTRALRAAGVALLGLWLAAAGGAARAHGASDAFLALAATPQGVGVRWDIALRDLEALVGLDADQDGAVTAAELRAAEPAVRRAALAAIAFSAGGAPCTPGAVEHGLARRGDSAFAVLRFPVACPSGSGAPLEVDYRLLADVDATHRAIVSLGDGERLVLLRPGAGPQAIRPATGEGGAFDGFAGFVSEGMAHILDGVDHLMFVLALALASVALAARGARPMRETLLSLAALLTLFTLAHSITLAGVALGWLSLPSRFVESVIAASVALAGVQALVAARGGPTAAARWGGTPGALVFAFGLIHGFGFGSALADLGGEGRPALAALLGFNLGVELGQLAALAVAFPLLWALRATRPYRAALQPALAAAIVVAGLGWFVQRALDLDVDLLAAAFAAAR